jgi:hypothetical protein
MALAREWGTGRDRLEDIEWLIGVWKGVGKDKDREISITFAKGADKPFVVGTFTASVKGRVASSGSMKIGIDPQRGPLRSWHFEDDGGHGQALWIRDGIAGSRSIAGVRMPTDLGLSHYSAFGAAGAVGVGHATTYWSGGVMTARAGAVRTSFPYYSAFRPGWYTAHPGAWFAARWTAARAWETPEWAYLASYVGVPPAASDYDYGSTIVLQDNDV